MLPLVAQRYYWYCYVVLLAFHAARMRCRPRSLRSRPSAAVARPTTKAIRLASQISAMTPAIYLSQTPCVGPPTVRASMLSTTSAACCDVGALSVPAITNARPMASVSRRFCCHSSWSRAVNDPSRSLGEAAHVLQSHSRFTRSNSWASNVTSRSVFDAKWSYKDPTVMPACLATVLRRTALKPPAVATARAASRIAALPPIPASESGAARNRMSIGTTTSLRR